MADERRNKRDKVQRNKNGDIEKKHSNIKNRKKSKKKKRTITVIISVIIAFVLLAMLGVCVVFQHFYGMMNISDGRFGNNTVGTVVSPNTDTNTDDPNSSEDRDTLA